MFNTISRLIKLTLLFGLLLNGLIVFSQNELTIDKRTSFSIGEIIEFRSDVLGENRIINIYLPNSYSPDSLKQYPVIYLLDGSADEDFIHIAGLVQFASFPWINTIPESIVVGISNIDRKRDFTFPTHNKKDKQAFPTTGGSEVFTNFLETELQPLIASTYTVNNTKTIIGQSLGGLLATEILFKRPNLFNNYIIISPSVWWDDESLLAFTPVVYSSKKSIYIAVGKEGPVMESGAKSLHEKLAVINQENTRLFYDYFDLLDHGDALHLSVYEAFKKIFETKER